MTSENSAINFVFTVVKMQVCASTCCVAFTAAQRGLICFFRGNEAGIISNRTQSFQEKSNGKLRRFTTSMVTAIVLPWKEAKILVIPDTFNEGPVAFVRDTLAAEMISNLRSVQIDSSIIECVEPESAITICSYLCESLNFDSHRFTEGRPLVGSEFSTRP